MIFDEKGLQGEIFHYAMLFFFIGSAFILFFYLWSKGKLHFDEEPKKQMMKEE